MTDISTLISRVLELDAEATEGPWEHYTISQHAPHPEEIEKVSNSDGVFRSQLAADNAYNDAQLMAEYRTLCPLLARECQRLRERVAELEELLNTVTVEIRCLERNSLRGTFRFPRKQLGSKRWEKLCADYRGHQVASYLLVLP